MVVGETQNPATPTASLEAWVPRPINPPGGQTKLRVFCFHGAGMESSIWTGTGTGKSPMPNPLYDFSKRENAQILAMQLPFRGLRRKDPHPKTIVECARQALEVMRPLIQSRECPYVLVGYSMGAWIAYEVLCAARKQGLPAAAHFIAAAMVSPNLSKTLRPWKVTANLGTSAFQDQLRAWNCNEVLFQPDMWAVYEPLLRADHDMLDSYAYTDMKGELKVPCSVLRGKQDAQLADDSLFEGWFQVLRQDPAPIKVVEGDHGLIFDPQKREVFFTRLCDVLESVMLGIEYGQ